MRVKSKVLFTIVAMMAILVCIPVLGNAQEQATDPDAILHFTENYDGWGLWDSEITTDPEYPERGNVIKVNPDRGGWFIFKELKPNTDYIATADVRVDGDITTDDINFEVLDFLYGNSGDHSDRIKAPVKSKTYKTVTIEFTTGDSTELNITCWSYSKTVGAYFDNIKLKEVTTATSSGGESVEESTAEIEDVTTTTSSGGESVEESTAETSRPNPKTGDDATGLFTNIMLIITSAFVFLFAIYKFKIGKLQKSK